MLKKIELPTAIVVVAFVAAYVVLAVMGKEVPAWLNVALGALGTLVAAAFPQLKKAEQEATGNPIQINQNGDPQ